MKVIDICVSNTFPFMKGVDIYENTESPLLSYEAKRREFIFLLLAQENIGQYKRHEEVECVL